MLDLIIYRNARDTQVPVFLTLPASRWDVLEASSLSETPDADYVFSIKLHNPKYDPDDSLFVELKLPAEQAQIDSALKKLNLTDEQDAEIIFFRSNISTFDGLAAPAGELTLLNDLAKKVNALDDNQYIKYQAVLEHEDFSKWHHAPPRGLAAAQLSGAGRRGFQGSSPFPAYP